MSKILILNGPNLNMLGLREPDIYGRKRLLDIERMCLDKAKELGWSIFFRQSNHEGELIDWIHEAVQAHYDAVIINGAAFTHTSIAIHDALKMLSCPIIEVHLSDPAQREDFRHISYIEPLAADVIKGQGAQGYVMALETCQRILSPK